MSTPDVRVRLSPEGIKEVIFALREVQKESGKATKNAAAGVGTLSSAVKELKGLLPALGLATVVGGFLALSAAAVKTADATGKIQQRVGGTVEDISALTLAFRTNESDQGALQAALLKTANVLQNVRGGSEETVKALAAIGITGDQITQLDTPRALELIAKQLAAIPNDGQRAALATQLFGKNAGELLVALRAVGTQGIDPFIEKARELGVLIDEDLANAAARANDALGIIKLQAEGLATQFASGLAPAVADAMETFTEATSGKGVNGMQQFGKVIGFIIRSAVALFVGFGKIVGAEAAKIGVFIRGVVDAAKALARGDFTGALEAAKRAAAERLQIEKDLAADLNKLGKDVIDGPKPGEKRSTAGTEGGAVATVDDSAKKASAARLAAQKQALQDELKLQQEGLKSAEAALKTNYDQGLISLQQFFDARAEIIKRNNAIEVAALKAQRAELVQQLGAGENAGGPANEAERIKIRQQIAQLDAQIRTQEIAGARELADLDAERVAGAKQLANELSAAAGKLAELENDRHAAFQANLAAEIEQLRELGARAGQTAEEIDAQATRLTNARTAAFNFDEVQRKGSAALASFDRDAEQISRDQQAGIITQLEGQQRLIELERQRLEQLKLLAQQLLLAADATGSEEQIAKAQAFAASVDQIAASYQNATDIGLQFRSGAVESFQQGIESLLTNADKIESVGDAFRTLALSVVQSLNKIAAEILAKQAVLALVRAFGGAGASAGAAAGSAAAYTGGRIRGYAGGGDVRGPRLNIPGPDKIPILAQDGEFMMRKARVQEPGALDFLRAWNSGRVSLAQALRVPRFATGGEIGQAAGTPAPGQQASPAQQNGVGTRIVNLLDPELVNDALASASGERVMLNVIQRNSVAIRRMLQGG